MQTKYKRQVEGLNFTKIIVYFIGICPKTVLIFVIYTPPYFMSVESWESDVLWN